MSSGRAVLVGTFDPLHGAHVGQILRAHAYRPFASVDILLDKHPVHKPNVTPWEQRLVVAQLTLAACKLPFEYRVTAVEDTETSEFTQAADYKIVGIDSAINDLQSPERWARAQRCLAVVLSVPGVPESALDEALSGLPEAERAKIHYEYVSEAAVPMMNWDFEAQAFAAQRVHSTGIRAGKQGAFLPPAAREYIREYGLYGA